MTSMMYVENDSTRLSVLAAQSAGVISLSPGALWCPLKGQFGDPLWVSIKCCVFHCLKIKINLNQSLNVNNISKYIFSKVLIDDRIF